MECSEVVASTKYQTSQRVSVHRSQLKGAPYNPRRITDKAKARLKANIAERGMMGGIIWNKRTGNLVGGHQRLGVLDELEGSQDYRLEVDMVDLGEQEEKEQNLFLNNVLSQGEWDPFMLEDMFTTEKVNADKSGFDAADVYALFGDAALMGQPKELGEMAAKLREAREREKEIKAKLGAKDLPDFYLLVVFKDSQVRAKAANALSSPDGRAVDGRVLLPALIKAGLLSEHAV